MTNARKIHGLEETDVTGKSVFCRTDFNVPLESGKVSDDTRIRAAIPTIRYLLENKARVVLASHLGRPKGKPDPKYSLMPVAERLAELIGREVILPDDCIGRGVKRILSTQEPKDVVLLENLRFHAEEEANNEDFAKELKGNLDVYVSDAFAALHRAHASTFALPRLFESRAAGFLVEKELKALSPLLENPARPYAVILGGAKISDKIKILDCLLPKIDRLFLGGAMVFTFLKGLGHKIGKSLVEESYIPYALRILQEAKNRNVQVYLPKDFRIGKSLEGEGDSKIVEGCDIISDWMGLDIGPKTIESFEEGLRGAKTIFWNGPLGLFEKPPFNSGTLGVAKILGDLHSVRIVGGGDSVAALVRAGVAEKMTFVSTGGGATLEFLEGKGLPGLEALGV